MREPQIINSETDKTIYVLFCVLSFGIVWLLRIIISQAIRMSVKFENSLSAKTSDIKTCKFCQKEIDKGTMFCKFCGKEQ